MNSNVVVTCTEKVLCGRESSAYLLSPPCVIRRALKQKEDIIALFRFEVCDDDDVPVSFLSVPQAGRKMALIFLLDTWRVANSSSVAIEK